MGYIGMAFAMAGLDIEGLRQGCRTDYDIRLP